MSFAATEFEFRHRFWFIMGIFGVAFWAYTFDRPNVSVVIARAIARATKAPNLDDAIDTYARAFFGLGALLVVAAAAVRSWAEAYLHSSIVHDRNLHLEQLVADGPFRHLRNPLYLGTVLLAIGIGFLASTTGFAILVVGMTLFAYRLILCEEARLSATQGESYQRYLASVPRILPSLAPRVPAAGARPNWMDGFTGEVAMWGCALGMVLFTATLNIVYYWVPFGVGFGVYFLQVAFRKRHGVAVPPTE